MYRPTTHKNQAEKGLVGVTGVKEPWESEGLEGSGGCLLLG